MFEVQNWASSRNGSIKKLTDLSWKKNFSRCRMDMRKVEHFIDFIFSNGLLQDVAYNVTKLKYDSGDKETIPHMILKSKYSHIIAFYQQCCFESSHTPLSESTLWKILHAKKPLHRTSLAGLDDITAMSMNGFDTLKQNSKRMQRKDNIA